MISIILIIYILIMIISSSIAFILFFADKKAAINNNNRIKEKTLLGFVAYGGALGGLLGSILARHKTNKIYFTISIYLGLICQVAALILLITML